MVLGDIMRVNGTNFIGLGGSGRFVNRLPLNGWRGGVLNTVPSIIRDPINFH